MGVSLAMFSWDLLKRILDQMVNLDLGTFPLTLIFFTKQHLEVQTSKQQRGQNCKHYFPSSRHSHASVYFPALWYNVGVLCLSYDSRKANYVGHTLKWLRAGQWSWSCFWFNRMTFSSPVFLQGNMVQFVLKFFLYNTSLFDSEYLFVSYCWKSQREGGH